jgi:hypothetical protein
VLERRVGKKIEKMAGNAMCLQIIGGGSWQ